MIRFAASSDTPAVIALWNRCFGDDPSFTDWFFRNRYRPEDTLLLLEEDTLCAMVQMLPYVVTIVVLIVVSMRKKKENQPPAHLGLAYFREER